MCLEGVPCLSPHLHFCFGFWIVPRIVLDGCCYLTLLFRCHSLQDLQDRMKKEAKREMDERTVLQRDEAAAAKEDEEFKVCSCCRIRARSAHDECPSFAPDRPFLFGRPVGRHDLGHRAHSRRCRLSDLLGSVLLIVGIVECGSCISLFWSGPPLAGEGLFGSP